MVSISEKRKQEALNNLKEDNENYVRTIKKTMNIFDPINKNKESFKGLIKIFDEVHYLEVHYRNRKTFDLHDILWRLLRLHTALKTIKEEKQYSKLIESIKKDKESAIKELEKVCIQVAVDESKGILDLFENNPKRLNKLRDLACKPELSEEYIQNIAKTLSELSDNLDKINSSKDKAESKN